MPSWASRKAVPETSVDEDNFLEPLEYQVRFPGQIGLVETEAISQPVGDLPYSQLGFGVLVSNQGHSAATFSLA